MPHTKPIELLVVDDNAAETFLLFYALEDCPMPVKFHFAKDGQEALQMLRERTFDLVILDLNLPGMSGYDVLEQCDPKGVPVVVFSVSSDEEDARRALELGARVPSTRLMLVNLYMREEKWDRALEQVTAYLTENPRAANRVQLEETRSKLTARLASPK